MAKLPCKRIVIATLLSFFFISITAKARILQEVKVSDVAKRFNQASEAAKKSNVDKLVANEDRELDGDELAAMDYASAGKTPMIHN